MSSELNRWKWTAQKETARRGGGGGGSIGRFRRQNLTWTRDEGHIFLRLDPRVFFTGYAQGISITILPSKFLLQNYFSHHFQCSRAREIQTRTASLQAEWKSNFSMTLRQSSKDDKYFMQEEEKTRKIAAAGRRMFDKELKKLLWEAAREINWMKSACWLKNWRQILIKFIFSCWTSSACPWTLLMLFFSFDLSNSEGNFSCVGLRICFVFDSARGKKSNWSIKSSRTTEIGAYRKIAHNWIIRRRSFA